MATGSRKTETVKPAGGYGRVGVAEIFEKIICDRLPVATPKIILYIYKVIKKSHIVTIFALGSFFGAGFTYAQVNPISLYPTEVHPGEPVMIQVDSNLASVKGITFGGVPVAIFKYKNKPTGIVGIDLQKPVGFYEIVVSFYNGTFATSTLQIKKKQIRVAPYTIPDKLGGTTAEGRKELIQSLAEENNSFRHIKTGKKIWWLGGFFPPLEKVKVNDEFGYHRQLGTMIMAHKGVDYSASEGTQVKSTNDGIVRVVGDYRNYGKTVIVDHGLGVLSFYLHLSETVVKEGEFVYRDQVVGLSGETGYADSPHLHFSIRIYGVSVDPVKFLELFK